MDYSYNDGRRSSAGARRDGKTVEGSAMLVGIGFLIPGWPARATQFRQFDVDDRPM